jgi:hypothetical protein
MMDERAAVVLAAAALLGLVIYLYFSPFQQCARELSAAGRKEPATECVTRMGGTGR